MGEFGNKFRKARESKGISLDDVSSVTKIGSRMLRAIEEEHFDQLPGGIFNKGFIRAYAKHLGLNDEEAINDYLACLRQAQVDGQDVWEPQPPSQSRPVPSANRRQGAPTKSGVESRPSPPPALPGEELPHLQLPRAEHVRPRRRDFVGKRESGIPWGILAVTAVVIVLVFILWTRHSRIARTQAASPAPVNTTPATQPAPAPISTNAPVPANHPSSPRTAPTPAPARSPVPNSPSRSTAQLSAATQQPIPASAAPGAAEGAGNNATNDQSLPVANSEPAEKPLRLVIRATENSWISVTADGRAVSQETLIAPANTSFRAAHEIVARVGNAAGLTFLWNGQEIPAQGAESEAKTLVFDSAGMRVLTQPQPLPHNP